MNKKSGLSRLAAKSTLALADYGNVLSHGEDIAEGEAHEL